jgi:putative lumazine-binding protein
MGVARPRESEEGELRIASLEVTRNIAAVKVVEDYASTRYTDYLSLVRFNGEWRIVNKVYTAGRRPGPTGAP